MRNQQTVRIQPRVILFCVLLVVSSGCDAVNEFPETTEVRHTASRIREVETAEATKTPTKSKTATSTIPFVPTKTPLPPLPLGEAQALSVELFQTNAGCRLPCWWGITPGETSWPDAHHFLSQFDPDIYIGGSVEASSFFADINIPIPEDMFPYYFAAHTYTVEKGIVKMIEVLTGGVSRYSLISILEEYGPPTEIWIWTYQNKYGSSFPFVLIFFYADQGIMASFETRAERVGDAVIGCPQDEVAIKLALWSPSLDISFYEALDMTREFDLRDVMGDPITIEEATGTSITDFDKVIDEPDNTFCLETPFDLWPPQP